MYKKPNGILTWSVEEIAKALRITPSDVREYFTDGRRVSFILERRIAKEVLNGNIASNEGKEFDIVDHRGRKWEVRSISRSGVYFCPSYMVGSGRHFEEKGFLQKLEEIDGYILADIESFPDIPFWIIPSDLVKGWWNSNKIGTTTKISRDKALALISSIGENKNGR